jgi:cytochrome c oxidase subunit 3
MGAYGATFFMLTGFHGFHVTIGTIMLIVILGRSIAGHFTADHHFAFEGVSWYWHFVDVVWLLLFVLVYWL